MLVDIRNIGQAGNRILRQIKDENLSKLRQLNSEMENINSLSTFVCEEFSLISRQFTRMGRMLNRAYSKNAFFTKSMYTSVCSTWDIVA